jgi:hypothetical protein
MNVGSTARVTARFKAGSALVDPPGVSMIVTPPGDDGVPDPGLAYTVTYPSVNLTRDPDDAIYYGFVPIDRRGRWRVEMRGSGDQGAGFVTIYAEG